jgi:membrane protein DedA with SNARE-associated domain
VAMLAVFGGDQLYFFIGRFKGAQILAKHPKMQAQAHRFDELLARWHAPLIVGIRFMYGFRIAGPILLGMGRVPAWKFMVFNFIGAAIWAPLVAGVGYLFGEALHAVLSDMKRFEIWGFLALFLVGLGAFALHRWRERREERSTQPMP